MKLSDLLLSEKEWTEIADKYMYYNTPDCAVKETAKFASLKTAKAIRDELQNAVKFPNDTVYQRLERFIKVAHNLNDTIGELEQI